MSRTKKQAQGKQGQIKPRGVDRDGVPKFLIRWRARRDGKSVIVSEMIHGSHAEAMKALAEHIINPNPAPKPVEKTFGSFLETEFAAYMHEHWKGSTQITHGCAVRRHILPFFEAMPLAKIGPKEILAFHSAMIAKGLGTNTRCNLHTLLTTIFNFAVEMELIEKTPMRRRLAPRRQPVEKPTLSAQQLEQLLQSVDVRHRAFFVTLALTGVRCSEALGLKWQDVSFADRVLHVRRAISRGQEATPKTKGSLRDRPMPGRLYESLLHHKAMAAYVQPTDFVFSSSSGRPMNPDQLREHLQATLGKIGVAFEQKRADGLHLLRHSGASILYQNTANVKATQEFLGHSTSKITLDVYTHVAPDQAQRSGLALEQAIFAQPAIPAGATN